MYNISITSFACFQSSLWTFSMDVCNTGAESRSHTSLLYSLLFNPRDMYIEFPGVYCTLNNIMSCYFPESGHLILSTLRNTEVVTIPARKIFSAILMESVQINHEGFR